MSSPDARHGAHVGEGGTHFRVRAPLAEAVWLCLDDGEGRDIRIATARNGDDWTVVADAPPGTRYGYRAAGPPPFDPAKMLVDPYALMLDRRFAWHPDLATFGAETAHLVPRAIVTAITRADAALTPPFAAGSLIYEVNVRAFTALNDAIPAAQRGTIAALAHPEIIAHLRRLHVSAVELMPIVAWIDERHLPPLGLKNAWGYNPIAFMALDPGLCPGGLAELRDTIAALHEAGIAVILDLVFNHTGESDLFGPTLSLRGLDDSAYARAADGTLINDTGTGNTLDFNRKHVRDLTLSALRHFAGCGIDGFRFDLATILARSPGFDPAAPFFAEIAADPLLADRLLIAEPWDAGPGGYQLSHFPGNWLEWNDTFRDDVRRFWRGDGTIGALATRLAGSSDVFGDQRTRTVNFLAAHDGFTLADVVRYATRVNWPNGEENRDGHAGEISWDAGDDASALVRAMLATLFASRGTIMLTAGDEFGRTQRGNNNAYAQDNATTWLDWEHRDRDLEAFVADLATRRAARPALTDTAMRHDATWTHLDGTPMTASDWSQSGAVQMAMPDGPIVNIDRAARNVVF